MKCGNPFFGCCGFLRRKMPSQSLTLRLIPYARGPLSLWTRGAASHEFPTRMESRKFKTIRQTRPAVWPHDCLHRPSAKATRVHVMIAIVCCTWAVQCTVCILQCYSH